MLKIKDKQPGFHAICVLRAGGIFNGRQIFALRIDVCSQANFMATQQKGQCA